MRTFGAAILLWCACVAVAIAGSLSEAEAERLRIEIETVTKAVERGDAELLINRTHASLLTLAGGEEAYARITREAVKQYGGVQFVSSEVGVPTQTFSAGDEEVCFVPRVSVFESGEKRAKSTTFMVAVRKIGAAEWTFLDGAGLRKHPDMLYQLLPELERGIELPPNFIEIL